VALGDEQVRYLFWSTGFSLRVTGGLYTRSTPMDERDLDGTGQAFAASLEELRPAHRGALPRAAALASAGKPKKSKKGDTQLRALGHDNIFTSLLQGLRT